MFLELFKWILSIAKIAALAIGAIVILVVFELMVKYKLLVLPVWTDNILDSLFYFGYDWERFGFASIVFRWAIVALVVWKLYDLGLIAYQYIIKKLNQP